jgi:tetratricopeptide (TPR) repeat protein
MQKNCDELAPFADNKELASAVHYWRGFALWRKAVNSFNDAVDPKDLEQDLKLATDEFKQVLARDPGFVDAKIGMISCLGYLAFMHRSDQAGAAELIGQVLPLVKDAKAAAPDNPRLLWVLGPILWNTPPERGGGQDKAIANYEKGLEIARKTKAPADRLEPSWGEPELLMNLAYSNLNKSTPDLNAAERCARTALELVPYWHYVRDILLAQILDAKAKVKNH